MLVNSLKRKIIYWQQASCTKQLLALGAPVAFIPWMNADKREVWNTDFPLTSLRVLLPWCYFSAQNYNDKHEVSLRQNFIDGISR